ncbi:hypothetical protein ACFX16_008102 [Malus domestica]
MRDDESLSMYLTRLLELVNQMKGYGEDLPRERLVQKLLISLTKEFDPVCYVIEQTKDIETIEVQEVIATLRGFAQCLDRHAESTIERAFSTLNLNSKGTQRNLSFGNSKPKKDWKSKGKKWDPKPQNLANRGGKYDQGGKSDQSMENASIVINCTMVNAGLKGSRNVMDAIVLVISSRIVINQTRLGNL